uniref:Uncharacterized protein n=1 Tax=Grammatophora oceanica TaxID=210454 RepID=A0A7S1ULK3_9STRA|mmetsp:Transcript_11444/g.16791  ORF Transcript_11444/g.16791 Transcript_11444/m.16791 type:complete len:324 (+) Transcript_11444:99-1070(+)|eukprot:CAMPEP_0194050226 /NCGR_PEP_ID=MMETSP0009_2-20130614/34020_1 /TAXON_ID=210454 /ORGANISM="Grammatophora oceanica, Strain CCMP 410" /LENGTH=323 /DNA_ID=CAMNT_0038696729 /DNA_START=85 /DNA_END=1056 /DNA_ORIENTATION=-
MSAPSSSLANRYEEYTLPLKKENGDEKDCANVLLALKYSGLSSSPPSPTSAVAALPSTSLSMGHTSPSLRKQHSYESDDTSSSSPSLADEVISSSSPEANGFEALLNRSPLVLPVDRDLVPDALFVAMAQMKPCALTNVDRVGCYKSRELGYTGFACAHCGGQPGFGRYFPATVRSLAQTTTSQTILKHVSIKCRYVPQNIRQGILTMQQQAAAEASAVGGRPRYGSRKVFFQKFWNRLHSMTPPSLEDEPLHALPSPASHESVLRMVSQSSSAASSSSDEGGFSSGDEVGCSGVASRKRGLPVKKNLVKRRSNSVAKRQRWN